MPHVRQLIRDAVVAALANLPTTGNRVFKSRVYPLDEDALPGLLVFSKSEETEADTISPPRSQTRQVAMMVEAYAKLNAGFDDKIDTICAEAEQAIGSDSTLGGAVKDIRLLSTEIAVTGSGEKPVAVATLTFKALYRTKENNPTIHI